MSARARTFAGAMALAVLAAGAAHAKGWAPGKPPFVKKGEVGAYACGNKEEDMGYICLVLACSRGAYRGSIYHAGGVEFDDSVGFEAGGQSVRVPLSPNKHDGTRHFTGNVAALAAVLATDSEMNVTGSFTPIPPGYGTFSPKGLKTQLARINKACGKADVAQAAPIAPPPAGAPPPSGSTGDAAAELLFLRKQLQVIAADDAAELRKQCVTKDPGRAGFCSCLSGAHVAEPSAPLAAKMSMWVLGRMFNPASSGGDNDAANGVAFSETEQENLRLASQRMALRVKQCMEAAPPAASPSK